ncbi:hypothetical protein GN244_ATG12311 [Phytophthora infestans]|uniref:Uncharacterized protein n=1 Tax=Phytophthora infestans TaxID=4787 RepID=A0A833WHX6_PHYIN|nr:hypothetical protein GN244_ATG12311 [Phytophthora infestans]KAF4150322.1 hypothetical protein GN958_ATG00530 [Phytophthora infestans]
MSLSAIAPRRSTPRCFIGQSRKFHSRAGAILKHVGPRADLSKFNVDQRTAITPEISERRGGETEAIFVAPEVSANFAAFRRRARTFFCHLTRKCFWQETTGANNALGGKFGEVS